MVNDFESVSKQWCDGEEVRLRDAVVLLSALQPAAAQLLERFAVKVSALPSCEKQEVFTNPELRKQLHGIYDSLLALHDDILVGAGGGDSRDRLISMLATIADYEHQTSILGRLPVVRWIRVAVSPTEGIFTAGDEYGVTIDGDIDVEGVSATLLQALDLIAMDGDCDRLVRTFISYIVHLRKSSPIQNLSFSARRLPNVVFKSDERSVYRCGETLVHEADHQFFYRLEDRYVFWRDSADAARPEHYSPWRDDRRPLDGILRGLSAFSRVARYYGAILHAAPESPQGSVVARLLHVLAECDCAAQTVVGSGQLSLDGLAYLEELAAAMAGARSAAKHWPAYAESWRTACDRVRNQREKRESDSAEARIRQGDAITSA